MNVLFHLKLKKRYYLPLARFEAGVGFINNVEAAFSTNNLAVGVTVFEGLNG